jgi:phosphate transport system substrate-binding protein
MKNIEKVLTIRGENKRMLKFKLQLLVLLSLSAIVLVACGGVPATIAPVATESLSPTSAEMPTEAAPPTEIAVPTTEPSQATESSPEAMSPLPETDPSTLSGDIVTAGSSTVFPLSERMAERFEEEGFTADLGTITIDSVGTGAGFERFCKTGETDISNASRAIKQEEIDNCAAINRTPIEFRVGTDALAVVVSSANDFVTDVTLEELAKIFSPDATLWSDIRPEWPAEDILRFSPGTDSGTFDYFVEAVMSPVYGTDNDADKNAILSAANTQFSEDDNVLVQGVEGSQYAIGYFGYAYFNENQEGLKAVSVNGIAPTEETAESGDYPLARPLFIYSDAAIMKSKPQVAGFINFYLTYVNEEILDVGYFPASQEALDQAMQNWLDAMK